MVTGSGEMKSYQKCVCFNVAKSTFTKMKNSVIDVYWKVTLHLEEYCTIIKIFFKIKETYFKSWNPLVNSWQLQYLLVMLSKTLSLQMTKLYFKSCYSGVPDRLQMMSIKMMSIKMMRNRLQSPWVTRWRGKRKEVSWIN